MIISLEDTSTRDVVSSLVSARRQVGPTSGMVLTLIVVSADRYRDQVLEAARASAMDHPSRVISVTFTDSEEPRLDAELQVGEGIPGDLINLSVSGPVRDHIQSVLLPLLLPDSPTVAWWPHDAPVELATDPIGELANRRISDATRAADPRAALLRQAEHHSYGDSDLSWTRLTRWRALLAAALDQYQQQVTSAKVWAAPDNAPALLMAAWLRCRLRVVVELIPGDAPGVSAVELDTDTGPISITRTADDGIALYRVPKQPERKVALKRRPLTDLLTEELSRLDGDETYEAAVAALCEAPS